MTLFVKAPAWLSCQISFAAEEILHVCRLWTDWRRVFRMKDRARTKTNLCCLRSTDQTDFNTSTSTTPAVIENRTAAVPSCVTRTSFLLEEELCRSPNSPKRTSFGSSTITVRKDGRYVTLVSKALTGDTVLKVEMVPTEQAFLKDSRKFATWKARIYLPEGEHLTSMLDDLK